MSDIVLLIDRLYCIDLFSCIAASLFNKLTYLLTYFNYPIGVINKPTTDELWISPVYRQLATQKNYHGHFSCNSHQHCSILVITHRTATANLPKNLPVKEFIKIG